MSAERENARTVAVFGGSSAAEGSPTWRQARDLGRAVAAEGWILLNGGYGGTMAAGARGAKEAGGRTQAVTLAAARAKPNPWVDEVTVADTIWQRLDLMIRIADGFVALAGGTDTLLEVAAVWEAVNKGFVSSKPLVLLGDVWLPLWRLIRAQPDVATRSAGAVAVADNVEEAVGLLRRHFARELA